MKKSTLIKIVSGVVVAASVLAATTTYIVKKVKKYTKNNHINNEDNVPKKEENETEIIETEKDNNSVENQSINNCCGSDKVNTIPISEERNGIDQDDIESIIMELKENPDEEKINLIAKWVIDDLEEEVARQRLFVASGQHMKYYPDDYTVDFFDLVWNASDIIGLTKDKNTVERIEKLFDEMKSLSDEYDRIHGDDDKMYL